jgi:hypothetical protein
MEALEVTIIQSFEATSPKKTTINVIPDMRHKNKSKQTS